MTDAEQYAPIDAIEDEPPNVWLTSVYGFNPETWGCVGFTLERSRRRFLERSRPGVLVVEYGASRAGDKSHRGLILGVLQCSHEVGKARTLIDDVAWQWKQEVPERRKQWNYGVRVVRAWRATPESRMPVREFAPQATASDAWQHIGSAGEPLAKAEAANIFKLDLEEVRVFNGPAITASVAGPARDILSPSRPGPVAQSSYTVREAEGPKHMYVLMLSGDPSVFLGQETDGRAIYKVGFSCSPEVRCDALNRSFPDGAFRWRVHRSTFGESGPLPSSAHAIAGENAMKAYLDGLERSLGGEFFLAQPREIDAAWKKAKKAARNKA